MRITLVGTVPPYKGGISEFNTRLIKELQKEHEVQIISWKQHYPSVVMKEQTDKNIPPLEGAQFVLSYKNPFTWNKAANLAKAFKPDVIIIPWLTPLATPTYAPLLKLMKTKTNAKLIALCHNVLPHKKTVLDKPFSKIFFSLIDEAIVHCEQDKEVLMKLNSKIKIKKGFHPLYDKYILDKKPAVLNNLKGNVMLFFGFIRPYKGVFYLLDALYEVLKQLDVHLLLVGEAWDGVEHDIIHIIKESGMEKHVTFVMDYVPNEEVAAYFDRADVVVLPYTSGTQSGIIQTAYYFDKPVICTNVGGFSEVVKDGKTGYVVAPRNEKALAEAIIKFYKGNKKKEFSSNVKKEKVKYGWDTYCEILLS